jgi:hypothetical protein
MKAGVEYGDLQNVPSDDAVDSAHRFELEPVVRGREFNLLGDGCANFRSQRCTFAITRPAVHDAMADRIDFRMFREKRFERRLEFRLYGAQVRAPQWPITRKIAEPAFEAAGATVYN